MAQLPDQITLRVVVEVLDDVQTNLRVLADEHAWACERLADDPDAPRHLKRHGDALAGLVRAITPKAR